jgi:hypothetical protein
VDESRLAASWHFDQEEEFKGIGGPRLRRHSRTTACTPCGSSLREHAGAWMTRRWPWPGIDPSGEGLLPQLDLKVGPERPEGHSDAILCVSLVTMYTKCTGWYQNGFNVGA